MKRQYKSKLHSMNYGFCSVPISEAVSKNVRLLTYHLDDYPYVGINSDLFKYISQTLDWIPRKDGDFQGVPTDCPTIEADGLAVAKGIFLGWLRIFSSCPDPIEFLVDSQLADGKYKDTYLLLNKSEIISPLEKIVEAISDAELTKKILVFCVRMPE